MMATLLLRCVAPLQAWDTQSRFGVRTTGREPSKSGIVGLLCAALGRPRWEPVDDLAVLKMAVRVDKEGRVLRDFHTAQNILKAGGGTKNTEVSTRYYLSDAAFLVGLEGDKTLLTQLHTALKNPHWMLCLGRKACPPSLPVYLPDGLKDEDLFTALKHYPWLGTVERQYKRLEDKVRVVFDDDHGPQVRHDHPISFEKGQRKFAPRRVNTKFINKPPFQPEQTSKVSADERRTNFEVSDEQEV
jgi:CRISPR system Cascade subunit CasD